MFHNTNMRGALAWALDTFSYLRPMAPYKPTGGHRAKGYQPTKYDLQRIEAAKAKRLRRAAVARLNYHRCLHNNDCLSNEQIEALL